MAHAVNHQHCAWCLDVFAPTELERGLCASCIRRLRQPGEEEVRQAQRKADAALVRAAGCQKLRRCGHVAIHDGEGKLIGLREVHDPACPVALADLLEGKP